MSIVTARQTEQETAETFLRDVRKRMRSSLSHTPFADVLNNLPGILGSGKMLRSRLTFRLGTATDIPRDALLHAAAAVEIIHAASLLHDDVIDGGTLRRGEPAFWVKYGVSGAILLGDLLLIKAIQQIHEVGNTELSGLFLRLIEEVCLGESEQELFCRGQTANWKAYEDFARRKTGALFAFAARACGGSDPALNRVLSECGYNIGTAYQLADDILDASGNPSKTDKTLGTDRFRAKNTAVSLSRDDRTAPVLRIRELCDQAERALRALAPWPRLQAAWAVYMDLDMGPTLKKYLAGYIQPTPTPSQAEKSTPPRRG